MHTIKASRRTGAMSPLVLAGRTSHGAETPVYGRTFTTTCGKEAVIHGFARRLCPPVSAANQGSYTGRFANPVRHCQWTATKVAITGAGGPPAFFNVRPSQFDTRQVFIFAGS